MILNRFFLSEEYKQYLTFSVEISTNTLITQNSKHLWSDEQEHTHNRIKSLPDSGKGYRTLLSYCMQKVIELRKIKNIKIQMFIQFLHDTLKDKHD